MQTKKPQEPPSEEGGCEIQELCPTPKGLKWNDWKMYMGPPGKRRTIPNNYPHIATVYVPRKTTRDKCAADNLLNIIEKPDVAGFTATTWNEKAYTKSFEKFDYGKSKNVPEIEPDLTLFADACVLAEVDYFSDSRVIPITATEKNIDSTPAFPKMLEYDTEKEFLASHGMNEYIEAQTNIEETVKHEPMWWCFLKNEVIKEKKVKDNDIRIISCTDPTYTRIGATLDQDQNARMKQRTETKHAQVGWTPFRGGLNKRLNRISKGRNTFVELDWTRFDGTIPVWLFQRIRRIRWFFVREPDRTTYFRLARWYSHRLTNRLTLFPTGEVTRICKGNPSGQFSTTVDNNLVNEWLTAFEFGYLYRKKNGVLPTVMEYRKAVDFLCYGDDRILAFDSNFVNYEPGAVIDMYKNYFGMWVKPENIKTSTSLDGLSFCGFTFVKAENRWVGIMNADKILQSLKTPTRALPDLESLWGKLVSLRILLQHADKKHRSYLDAQIARVEAYARAEGVELPEISADLYRTIW
uniref:Non-structural polyprotein 1AB n=1 Tax=Ruddy turnstone astrovirus TaxID=2565393 RepID=A0A4P8JE55_9VIRU|nr:ORF1b [Ruddy turnstone astrovirus]